MAIAILSAAVAAASGLLKSKKGKEFISKAATSLGNSANKAQRVQALRDKLKDSHFRQLKAQLDIQAKAKGWKINPDGTYTIKGNKVIDPLGVLVKDFDKVTSEKIEAVKKKEDAVKAGNHSPNETIMKMGFDTVKSGLNTMYGGATGEDLRDFDMSETVKDGATSASFGSGLIAKVVLGLAVGGVIWKLVKS